MEFLLFNPYIAILLLPLELLFLRSNILPLSPSHSLGNVRPLQGLLLPHEYYIIMSVTYHTLMLVLPDKHN